MSFPKKTVLIVGLLWLLAVGAGLYVMLIYETTPGIAGSPPVDWPSESLISRSQPQADLVMFVHPRCPCTRASIGELSRLMAQCQGKVKAHVLAYKPEGFAEGWEKTDIWTAAAEIPGVTVATDAGGAEARRFNAKISGETFLYDDKGLLLFKGGITGSRGHAGDNAGRSAIVSILNGGQIERRENFVFGCSLFDQSEDQMQFEDQRSKLESR